MPALEIGYCSLKDYEAGKPSRLMPENLAVDELYVLMVALDQVAQRRLHGKRPRTCSAILACRELCRVYDVEQEGSGLYRVDFDIVNEDNEGVWDEADSRFADGFWTGIDPDDDLGINGELVRSGYLQSYDDPLDGEIRDYLNSLDLPAQSVLVSSVTD